MPSFLLSTALTVLLSGAAFAADLKAGKAVYDKSCKSCHGADGTPVPTIQKMLKVEMRDLKSQEVQSLSDADLRKASIQGQGKMKPVTGITGADVDNLLAYVRSLRK